MGRRLRLTLSLHFLVAGLGGWLVGWSVDATLRNDDGASNAITIIIIITWKVNLQGPATTRGTAPAEAASPRAGSSSVLSHSVEYIVVGDWWVAIRRCAELH